MDGVRGLAESLLPKFHHLRHKAMPKDFSSVSESNTSDIKSRAIKYQKYKKHLKTRTSSRNPQRRELLADSKHEESKDAKRISRESRTRRGNTSKAGNPKGSRNELMSPKSKGVARKLPKIDTGSPSQRNSQPNPVKLRSINKGSPPPHDSEDTKAISREARIEPGNPAKRGNSKASRSAPRGSERVRKLPRINKGSPPQHNSEDN